jgi:hypothetical protein
MCLEAYPKTEKHINCIHVSHIAYLADVLRATHKFKDIHIVSTASAYIIADDFIFIPANDQLKDSDDYHRMFRLPKKGICIFISLSLLASQNTALILNAIDESWMKNYYK